MSIFQFNKNHLNLGIMELASYCHWLGVFLAWLLLPDMLFQTCTYISNTIYRYRARCTLIYGHATRERERQGKRGRGSQPITGCQNSSVALLPPHLDWLCFLSLCCGSSYILRLIKNTICQCVGQVCACLCVCQRMCAHVTCIYANTYVRICWNTARHAHNMTARS